jgi:hypothetical protein
MAAKQAGFLDGAEGKSSKRLLSILGWAAALAIAVAGLAFPKISGTTVQGLVIAFLTFSAALQGVSAYSERKLK